MWKKCNINDNYIVSDDGFVKSIKTNKILKQKLDKDNYLSVNLSMGKRGTARQIFVHRLVAEAFIPNPENKSLVLHIDGNPVNNCVSNLKWVTPKENVKHSIKIGLKENDHGSLSCNSKLSPNEISYCRKMYQPRSKLYGCGALAKRFGVSKSTMSYILNNKTYIPR